MPRSRDQQHADSDDKYRRNFHGIDPSTPAPNFARNWDDHDTDGEDNDEDDEFDDEDFDDDAGEFDEDEFEDDDE